MPSAAVISTSTLPSGLTIALPAQAQPGPTRQVRLRAMHVSPHGCPVVHARPSCCRACAAGGGGGGGAVGATVGAGGDGAGGGGSTGVRRGGRSPRPRRAQCRPPARQPAARFPPNSTARAPLSGAAPPSGRPLLPRSGRQGRPRRRLPSRPCRPPRSAARPHRWDRIATALASNTAFPNPS